MTELFTSPKQVDDTHLSAFRVKNFQVPTTISTFQFLLISIHCRRGYIHSRLKRYRKEKKIQDLARTCTVLSLVRTFIHLA